MLVHKSYISYEVNVIILPMIRLSLKFCNKGHSVSDWGIIFLTFVGCRQCHFTEIWYQGCAGDGHKEKSEQKKMKTGNKTCRQNLSRNSSEGTQDKNNLLLEEKVRLIYLFILLLLKNSAGLFSLSPFFKLLIIDISFSSLFVEDF